MNVENTAPEQVRKMLEPLENDEFGFSCHPGISCFTECCRKLNLLMTPYDVLRLRKHLGMDSDDFLDEYAEIRFDHSRRLPAVYLKMGDDERKTCPFVTPEGCRVYQDRPSACRTYPLARASRKHPTHGTVQESYYSVREDHCRGFEESRRWSVNEWVQDQGLAPYHEMNNLWMEIVTHPNSRGELSEKQQQIFFMASYNMDLFRGFVLGSRFLQMFAIDPEEEKAIREDDGALLRLGFKWLRFSLLNEQTLKRRS